jgi:hypothetical protein
LLSVVVVSLLGSAAPGFADGPTAGRSDDRGGADHRTDRVGDVHEKPDRVQRGRDGGDAPAAAPAEPPATATAGPERAARTAAPAAAPSANVLTEAPAALAAPVVGLTAPVIAPTAPQAVPVAPASPSAPEAPSPAQSSNVLLSRAPLADVLLSSAPPLAPPAGAVVPASSPTAAPVGAASPAAAPVPDAPAPAQIDSAPPPAAQDAGGERRAESPRTVAERSFTALLLMMAAVLVFLVVHGRVDRRDPKLGDRPGDFRRFR